jgi:hypothetical protein
MKAKLVKHAAPRRQVVKPLDPAPVPPPVMKPAAPPPPPPAPPKLPAEFKAETVCVDRGKRRLILTDAGGDQFTVKLTEHGWTTFLMNVRGLG